MFSYELQRPGAGSWSACWLADAAAAPPGRAEVSKCNGAANVILKNDMLNHPRELAAWAGALLSTLLCSSCPAARKLWPCQPVTEFMLDIHLCTVMTCVICRDWPAEASQYELLEFAGKGAHAVVSVCMLHLSHSRRLLHRGSTAFKNLQHSNSNVALGPRSYAASSALIAVAVDDQQGGARISAAAGCTCRSTKVAARRQVRLWPSRGWT